MLDLPISKMCSDGEELLVVKNLTTAGFICHLRAQQPEQHAVTMLPTFNPVNVIFGVGVQLKVLVFQQKNHFGVSLLSETF